MLYTVSLSIPEMKSPPKHHQQHSLQRSRDQDGGDCAAKRGAASSSAPLSLRLSTQISMTSRAAAVSMTSSPRLSTLAPALGGLDAHRRRRTAFTSDQLLELEKEFHSKN